MTKYVKYAGRLVALFLIFLAILVALGFVFEPKDNTREAGMRDVAANGSLGEPQGTLDVLFAGDSICSTAFAPLKMYDTQGFTSYNTATTGQKIFNTVQFVDAALDVQKPKVLVLEADVLFYGKNTMTAACSALMDAFPLFHYHNRWKNLTLADFTTMPHYTHTEKYKGYYIVRDKNPMEKPQAIKSDNGRGDGSGSGSSEGQSSQGTSSVPFVHALFAKKMIADAQACGTKVVIVASPCSRNWHESRRDAVEKLCAETGADFLDMNTQEWQDRIGLDYSTDIRDNGEHVNASGGMKTSAALAEWLSATYDLPDHRSDPNYAEWEASAQDFLKEVSEINYNLYVSNGVIDTERIDPRIPNEEL